MYIHISLQVYYICTMSINLHLWIKKTCFSLHLPINGLGDKFSTSTSAPWWWIKLPQLLPTHRHRCILLTWSLAASLPLKDGWLEGHVRLSFWILLVTFHGAFAVKLWGGNMRIYIYLSRGTCGLHAHPSWSKRNSIWIWPKKTPKRLQ